MYKNNLLSTMVITRRTTRNQL